MTSPRRRERVLIKFTKQTVDAEGTVLRREGDLVYVDPVSARSFEKDGVAKKVTAKEAEKVESAEKPEQTGVVGGAG